MNSGGIAPCALDEIIYLFNNTLKAFKDFKSNQKKCME